MATEQEIEQYKAEGANGVRTPLVSMLRDLYEEELKNGIQLRAEGIKVALDAVKGSLS